MRLKKLPKHYAGLVQPLVLTMLMTCVVSAISVLRSRGFDSGFVEVWPTAWMISWAVAYPAILMILPVVRRIVAATVES
ncbi:conserved exported protein of unknown function [Magnetospirillum sp. XM-1]|uniref:DUF2798 domain-containing protein n=1 Tax=Magnetospirillum sp. XM-1 TaxID=1663591 RepID=UPI00073DD070|nr:DUF2798 domain-containing protein [Magnetospirillum sp. XM-1]CUW39237.1 conserved exported protein of unknown function [Magnetospirillum sp. XM-1]